MAKISELAEKARVCFFVTNLKREPLDARPMSVLKVDEKGQIWFFTDQNSETVRDIQSDKASQLFFSNSSTSEYISLYGLTEIVNDREKINELWTPIAKTWFSEGKDDPRLSLIRFTPESGHYWDTKTNKAIQMVKLLFGAITGKPTYDGVQGQVAP